MLGYHDLVPSIYTPRIAAGEGAAAAHGDAAHRARNDAAHPAAVDGGEEGLQRGQRSDEAPAVTVWLHLHLTEPLLRTRDLIRDTLQASHRIHITPWWLAGCLAMAAGGAIRLACYRTLGRFFTWELSVKKGHMLVTSGPYSIVRHPSYVGSTLIGVGVVLCHFGPGSWYAECVGWETWGSCIYTALWGAWSLAVPVLLCARTPTEDGIRLIPFVY